MRIGLASFVLGACLEAHFASIQKMTIRNVVFTNPLPSRGKYAFVSEFDMSQSLHSKRVDL